MDAPNPNTYVIRPRAVLIGTPPASSYWVGASRAELQAAVIERRPFQATASEKDLFFDPLVGATAAWQEARRKVQWRRLARRLAK